jgi:hypothetical protein
VVAPRLVRVQAFRDGKTLELLLTRHELFSPVEGRRPSLHNQILFHGVHGTFPMHASVQEGNLRCGFLPEFLSRAGEPLSVPSVLQEAARLAIGGTYCLGCKTPQLLLPRAAALPQSASC